MAESSLNYQQTSYPAEPDISWEAYMRSTFPNAQPWAYTAPRALGQLGAWMFGKSNYDTWAQNVMNAYQNRVNQYTDYINSPEGNRVLQENAGYNVNYSPSQHAPSSFPMDYQIPDPGIGQVELGKGISGIFNLVNMIMAVKSMGASIAGQELKNQAQSITNRFLAKKLQYGVEGLGYQNDRQQFLLEELFFPRWSKYPEMWKGGVFSPYGRGSYDLRDADQGLGYRRQVADLDYIEAGKKLRESVEALNNASKREKDWYYQNVKDVQLEIMKHSRDILKGTYDFQKTEQNIRKWGAIANISTQVVNAAVNTIKAFVPGPGQLIGGLSGLGSPKGFTGTPGSYNQNDALNPVLYGSGNGDVADYIGAMF